MVTSSFYYLVSALSGDPFLFYKKSWIKTRKINKKPPSPLLQQANAFGKSGEGGKLEGQSFADIVVKDYSTLTEHILTNQI